MQLNDDKTKNTLALDVWYNGFVRIFSKKKKRVCSQFRIHKPIKLNVALFKSIAKTVFKFTLILSEIYDFVGEQ